jgi:hypothetical protein
MPSEEIVKSLATKDSNSFELYENRKAYKNRTLTSYGDHGGTRYIQPGIAEFWYDRYLYGKVNRQGDIVIMREDFLKTLRGSSKGTFYALNFVALAFSEMKNYLERHTGPNRIPNKKTLFALLNPAAAWQGIYNQYHDYMKGTYTVFLDYLTQFGREKNINNFDDFIEEYFIFCQNTITTVDNPITLSGFVTNGHVSAHCGGLTIDLFKARASNDPLKNDLFIRDINFDFFVHAATKHGFVIDKNVPWRLTANLNSDYMRRLMESIAFDVTYSLGPRHVFDIYYLKTYTMDLILLRKYMYDMYNSLLIHTPFYTKYKYCNNTGKTKNIKVTRRPITSAAAEHLYTVKDYWLEKAHRFRLLELDHDLQEENIKKQIKNAKSVYDIRGEMHSLKYLHNHTKRFFLHEYNKLNANLKLNIPQHSPKIT